MARKCGMRAKNGRPCSICGTDKQQGIDLAIAGGKSARFVSQSFGVSVYAVQRHRAQHVKPAVARAAERREDLSAERLIEKMQDLLAEAEGGIEIAKRDKDLQGLSRCLKEARECLVKLGQTRGQWMPKQSNTFIDNRRQTMIFDGKDLDELRALRQSLTALGTV